MLDQRRHRGLTPRFGHIFAPLCTIVMLIAVLTAAADDEKARAETSGDRTFKCYVFDSEKDETPKQGENCKACMNVTLPVTGPYPHHTRFTQGCTSDVHENLGCKWRRSRAHTIECRRLRR